MSHIILLFKRTCWAQTPGNFFLSSLQMSRVHFKPISNSSGNCDMVDTSLQRSYRFPPIGWAEVSSQITAQGAEPDSTPCAVSEHLFSIYDQRADTQMWVLYL